VPSYDFWGPMSSHMLTPAVSSREDTSCVLSEKTKTIKINKLLFISILFYENQQTTPNFKVGIPDF
ncbi:hypothetical protein, partial [Escherichia coli]|uniref:hypothetical protein n=1 Tax=Escherichia coli TaxID=562 RepID=UPI001CCE290E